MRTLNPNNVISFHVLVQPLAEAVDVLDSIETNERRRVSQSRDLVIVYEHTGRY
jgi:hypothetical protein